MVLATGLMRVAHKIGIFPIPDSAFANRVCAGKLIAGLGGVGTRLEVPAPHMKGLDTAVLVAGAGAAAIVIWSRVSAWGASEEKHTAEAEDAHASDREETVEEATAAAEDHCCPICMDTIDAEAAVMRCVHTHYCHVACLQRWIQHQRAQRAGASCPLCRGTIRVHTGRLRGFLEGGAGTLDATSRGFLERILERAKGQVGWVEVSPETLLQGGALLATAAWGFYSGWSGRSWGDADELIYEWQSPHIQAAVDAGWALGLSARAGRALCRVIVQQLVHVDHERGRR